MALATAREGYPRWNNDPQVVPAIGLSIEREVQIHRSETEDVPVIGVPVFSLIAGGAMVLHRYSFSSLVPDWPTPLH
jgi:hypothetical protein